MTTEHRCDLCDGEAFYTRYDAPIEVAVAMRERGEEPQAAARLCRAHALNDVQSVLGKDREVHLRERVQLAQPAEFVCIDPAKETTLCGKG